MTRPAVSPSDLGALRGELERARMFEGANAGPATLAALQSLGVALLKAGQPADARTLFEEVVELASKLSGRVSLPVAEALQYLARATFLSECRIPGIGSEHSEVLPLLEEALRIREEVGDSDGIVDAIRLLTSTLPLAGREAEVVPLLRRAIEVESAGREPTQGRVLGLELRLAQAILSSTRGGAHKDGDAEALEILSRILESTRFAVAGDDDSDEASLFVMAAEERADVRQNQGSPADAVVDLELAVGFELRRHGDAPLPIAAAMRCRNLAILIERLGRTSDALPYLARAVRELRGSAQMDQDIVDADERLLSLLSLLSQLSCRLRMD